MEAEPFAGMPMPLKVEAPGADPVQTRECRVKLLAEVLGKAGPIALNEAIACSVPFPADVNRVVELGRPDDGQESRFQYLVDQSLTGGGDGDLLSLGKGAPAPNRGPLPLTHDRSFTPRQRRVSDCPS